MIFALSRFGGLRCPSEHLALRWQNIDWAQSRITVWSPKTEGHEGKELRLMPLFPELLPILMEAFEKAEPGSEFVNTRYRCPTTNLRTQFLKILSRAGVTPWPKLFHNLRSSRQTELCDSHPAHVVSAWLGNSVVIAQNHYLQVLPSHFDSAVAPDVAAANLRSAQIKNKPAQKEAQAAAVLSRTALQSEIGGSPEVATVQRDTAPSMTVPYHEVTPRGFEPLSPG